MSEQRTHPYDDEDPALQGQVTETETEAEFEPVGEPVAPLAGPRRRRPTLLLGALALVLAVVVGVLGVLVQRAQGPAESTVSGRQALEAARGAARAIFSYDYRRLERDFAAGVAVTTGAFRKEYQSTTSTVVGDVAPRYKAVVIADVSEAAVVRATPDRVVVLAFIDQQSTSTQVATPKITQSRVEMTMVRSGGRWLVSEIRAF